MRTDVSIGILDVFIFLAVFQTIYISYFIIKNGKAYSRANIYQGLFLLSFALLAFEEFLNNTGYMSRVLWLNSFSQPLNFVLGPLFYLYVVYSFDQDKEKKIWGHFIFPVFWLLYTGFYLAQPPEVKYNSYISLKHPDWEQLKIITDFSQDPLGIRQYCNQLTIISLFVYYIASLVEILKKLKKSGLSFFSLKIPGIVTVRNSFIHSFLVILVYGILKIAWGFNYDAGMIVVTYFCIYIFLLSYKITNMSTFFSQPFSVLDFPTTKYKKSSLSIEQKDEILDLIKHEMEENHYYANNLSSLSGLSKKINRSAHHVSQVINERFNMNFYELLSIYRIELAKKLIKEDIKNELTVEELAEKVGYNSKSSFNSAFKKLTSTTPSEYRKALKIN